MDKVSSNQSQGYAVWQRAKSSSGHRSAVQAAVRAHRQQVRARNERIEERQMGIDQQLLVPRNPSMNPQSVSNNQLQNMEVMQANLPQQALNLETNINGLQEEVIARPQTDYMPRQIDEFYGEAQLGSGMDRALNVVTKELSAPDTSTDDETPKGSYVDYTV